MSQTRTSLNDEQRDAVAADRARSLNVIAGAGTGKTTVLVERFLKLVRDDGIQPDRILALTFTLKAAAEMRHRVHRAFEREMPERTRELHGAWIMNFHQFGHRLIRENAPAFGVDPDVDVLTSADHRRLERRLERRFKEGQIDGVPEDLGGELPPPARLDSRFQTLLNAALDCRSKLYYEADVEHSLRGDDHAVYLAHVEAIIALGKAYEAELRRMGMIDFTDMIVIPVRGLRETDSLRERYVGMFDHILVDEFQDTSAAQNELLKLLSGGAFEHVTVVGDEKQAIYRWRDARVENIREFPGEPSPLRVNYRSRQHILDLTTAFICGDPEFGDKPESVALDAHKGEAQYPIVLFHPTDDCESPQAEEAEALAAWVRALTEDVAVPGATPPGRRLAYDEVAVLLRGMTGSGALPWIERAFERHHIPYTVVGGANAMETRALDAWHAMLSLLLGGDRIRDLMTVMQSEPWSVHDDALRQMVVDAKRHPGGRETWLGDDVIARVGDEAVAERLRALRSILEEWERRWKTSSFHSFLAWTIAESPLSLRLFADGASASAVDDLVGEITDVAQTLNRRGELNVRVFLDHLRTMIDDKKFRDDTDVRLPSGRVRIMTIHQSKGLEFPAVALAGLRPKPGGGDHSCVSRDHGIFFSASLGEAWKRGRKQNPDHEAEKRMDDLEERCIVYVAMTRAEEHLFVSCAGADGSIASGNRKLKTLFIDVLSAAADVRDLDVWRAAPPVDVGGALAQRAEPDPASVFALASESRAIRENLEAHRVRPRRAAPPLEFVNWLGLYAFAQCPLQFRYRYRVGLAGEVSPPNDTDSGPASADGDAISAVEVPSGASPAQYGSIVHDALEAWATFGEVPAGDTIEALAVKHGIAPRRATGVASACAKLLSGVSSGELGLFGDDLRAEEPFQARVGGVVFHGVIDRMEKRDDSWQVTDYKIGTEQPHYAYQVTFYAWALFRATGDEPTGQLCYLRSDGARIVPAFVKGDIERVAGDAGRLQHAAETGEFTATPGDVCGTCAYRGICPSSTTLS